MTYNVRGCRGLDMRLDVSRIAGVIRDSGADVVALQEVDVERPRSGRIDQARALAEQLGMFHDFCSARDCDGGRYGNAILSRFPVSSVRGACLPRSGHRLEPRAVQWTRIEAPSLELNVLNTHLGLDKHERLLHSEAILREWLSDALAGGPTALCGDFNARETSPEYLRLTSALHDAQARLPRAAKATFPSVWPLMRIDHLLVSDALRVSSCTVVASWRTKVASDHLPIIAEVELERGTGTHEPNPATRA